MRGRPRTVQHLLSQAGAYSEIWLDAQISGTDRYRSSAWRLRGEISPYRWSHRATHVRDVRLLAETALRLWRRGGSRGSLRPLSALLRAAASRGLKDPPAVLHAHFGTVAWEWLGLVRDWDVPLVVSFYGFDGSKREYTVEPWRSRYVELFDRTAAVIVEGPAMMRRVEALSCSPKKLHVVRLPFANVDIPDRDVQAPPRWSAIMAGRFVEKKGFDVGVEAFARSSAGGRLLLVGDGPLESRLRHQVEKLGIGSRVDFVAPVPVEELTELFRRSQVALFPSRTANDGDGEGGAPLTLTLAQFVGTPVIVTDHDDLPWAAAPGTPIVPAGDVDALAAELAGTYRTVEWRREQASRARAFVEQEHAVQRLIRAREAIYDSVSSG